MTIYHINKENKIEKCLTRGTPCTMGGADNHFLSYDSAKNTLDLKMESKNKTLQGNSPKEKRLQNLLEIMQFREKEYLYLKETNNTFFTDDINPLFPIECRVKYLNEKYEFNGYRMNLETVRYNLNKINKDELLVLLYVFQRIIKTQEKQYAVYIDYEQVAKDLKMDKDFIYNTLAKENYIEYKLENYLVLVV